MSDAAFVGEALRRFGVVYADVMPVHSANNGVYRIETPGGGLALRIHRPGYRTPAQTGAELAFLAALAADGAVTVPRPVAAPDGSFVVEVEGASGRRHCSLLTWLDGQPERPPGDRAAARMGEMLGHIHRLGATFPAAAELPAWEPATMLGEASPFRPGDLAALTPDRRAMLALVEERVVAAIADSGGSPGGYGVIHHDFILQNCLHHEGRTAVIDFDDCGRGFHLTDLGAMLGNLADYEDDGLRAGFLEGYAHVRSIPAEWEDQFELMVALRHAVTVMWLLGLRHTGRASAGFVERHLEHRFAAIARTLGR